MSWGLVWQCGPLLLPWQALRHSLHCTWCILHLLVLLASLPRTRQAVPYTALLCYWHVGIALWPTWHTTLRVQGPDAALPWVPVLGLVQLLPLLLVVPRGWRLLLGWHRPLGPGLLLLVLVWLLLLMR